MRDNDSIYYDLYLEGDAQDEEKSRGQKIFHRILKTVGITLILAVYAILMYRIFANQEPGKAKEYLWTESALAACQNADGDHPFVIYTQKPANYTLRDETTGSAQVVEWDEYYTVNTEKGSPIDGNYKFSNFCYTPAAGQVQVTFRYNKAVLPYLMADTGETSLPEYPFVFALESGGKFYTDYQFLAFTRSRYTYRRLVFEGLPESTEELGKTVTLHVYYAGRPVDLTSPYLSLVIYDENARLVYDSKTKETKEKPLDVRKEKTPGSPDALEAAPAYVIIPQKEETGPASSGAASSGAASSDAASSGMASSGMASSGAASSGAASSGAAASGGGPDD